MPTNRDIADQLDLVYQLMQLAAKTGLKRLLLIVPLKPFEDLKRT